MSAGSRHRPAAFAATLLTIFTTIFASNLPTPFYAVWQAEWGFSATALTAVFAVYVLGVLLMLPTAGPLSDLLGRRQLMIPGMAFTAAAGLVFAGAADLQWLALGRFLTGLGTGMVTGAATAALIELDSRGNRAHAGTLSALAFTAGATAGPLVGSLALRWLPAPTVFCFLAVAALALGNAFLLSKVAWPAPPAQEGGAVQLRRWRPQRLRVPREIWPGFAVAGVAVALTWSTGSLYASLGPSIAADLVGVRDRSLAGLYAAGFQLAGGLGQLAFRRHSPRLLMLFGPAALVSGMLVSMAGVMLMSPLLFLVGTLTTALGGGAASVGSVAVVSVLAPDRQRGEIISAFYMIAYLTMATVVFTVGLSSDRFGLKSTLAVLTGCLVVAAAWLIWRCRRQDPAAPAPASLEQRPLAGA